MVDASPIGTSIPIGRAISNRAYILDDRLRPVLTEAAGELYLSDDGPARGYLKRLQLAGNASCRIRTGKQERGCIERAITSSICLTAAANISAESTDR